MLSKVFVKSLHIYPVKSCQGITLGKTEVRERGLLGDRLAMLVSEDGKFVSLRTHPKLTGVFAEWRNEDLWLDFGGYSFPVGWSEYRRNCRIWNDEVDLGVAVVEVNEALSDFLGEQVQLVLMDERSRRQTSGTWADSANSLSDGYPILVTNTASLLDLSAKADTTLFMEQFRPNIVIKSDKPWIEDTWQHIRIGEVEIKLVKPCTRCLVTTLNSQTGARDFPETMEAMIKYRRSGDPRVKGVIFGWNGIVLKAGSMSKNDPVEVINKRTCWPIQ